MKIDEKQMGCSIIIKKDFSSLSGRTKFLNPFLAWQQEVSAAAKTGFYWSDCIFKGCFMAKQTDTIQGYVKKSSLLLACLISAAVGFLGGVVLSAYKSNSAIPLPASGPGQQPALSQKLSDERAGVIEALQQETTKNPSNINAWIELGNNYFDTDQFEKSIQAYEQALALNPNNANVLTDLGVMYRRSGQPKKAIAAFDKAIAADPKHETARFNKGIVLMHDLNDRKGAMEAWTDLVRINPLAKSPNGLLIKDMVDKLKQGKS
jgi:cytochrome c-type biogenesis protein CcmH/NrfG